MVSQSHQARRFPKLISKMVGKFSFRGLGLGDSSKECLRVEALMLMQMDSQRHLRCCAVDATIITYFENCGGTNSQHCYIFICRSVPDPN